MMNLREWALPVYTILIQLGTGALMTLWMIRALGGSLVKREDFDEIAKIPVLIVLFTIFAAVVGAQFHLSRPYLSFLAILNFQSSWLRREIIFTVLLFLLTGGLTILLWFVEGYPRLKGALGWGAILSGLITIYCMARIYMLPTQISWNSPVTIISYYISTLLLGEMSIAAILPMEHSFAEVRGTNILEIRTQLVRKALIWLAAVTVFTAILTVIIYFYQIESLLNIEHRSAQASINLMLGLYKPLLLIRILLLLLGTGGMFVSIRYISRDKKTIKELIGPAYVFCTFVVVSEILGRFLFYASHVRIGI